MLEHDTIVNSFNSFNFADNQYTITTEKGRVGSFAGTTSNQPELWAQITVDIKQTLFGCFLRRET